MRPLLGSRKYVLVYKLLQIFRYRTCYISPKSDGLQGRTVFIRRNSRSQKKPLSFVKWDCIFRIYTIMRVFLVR